MTVQTQVLHRYFAIGTEQRKLRPRLIKPGCGIFSAVSRRLLYGADQQFVCFVCRDEANSSPQPFRI